ncbi:uncharacterized protein LOC123526175 [Mercenaria mercenaria]|uniref:uncharacterized protein LOC123526175 n=1 Tax=Mercenaria mercenaria TaxID=6596 RepID=UPI00234F1BB8|nr:uncharacterized protein LOC123526175 [Mercenaria mercenaria]
MKSLQLFIGVVVLTYSVIAQNFPAQPNVPQNQQFNPQSNVPTNPQFNQPPQPNVPRNPQFPQPTMSQPPQTAQAFQPGQPTNQNFPQQPGQMGPGNANTNANMNGNQINTQDLSPEQQSQITCAQAGRTAVSQCFQQNGGFQMITVIALLSNGTQGQLPPNSDQIKQNLCQSQGQIVACVFNNIRRFNGTQQCSTPAAYIRLEQETVGLLNGVQQMCGKGLMPKVTPCMQRLNYDMMQCYEEAGLNAELFSPRGSRMEGAVIGDNREVARMFCSKRKELYSCQNRVLDRCEGAKTLQELGGNDQTSMQDGMDVLCKDVDVYVSGLVCFQSTTPKVESCASDLIGQMTELTMNQIKENMNSDTFFREYCKVRISNLQCDSNAWEQSCERVAVGLKTEYQCNLLPAKCKNDSVINNLYMQACADTAFARELRNTDSGAASVLTGVSTILAAIFTAFVVAL